jgi:hypothetical protein
MTFIFSKSVVLLASTLIFVLSCGKKDNSTSVSDTGNVGGTEFIKQNSSALSFANGGVTGTGQLVAKLPADEVGGEKNFALSFSLQDRGSLVLDAFSTNTLTNGVKVKFERTAAALKVSIIMGITSVDVSSKFSGVNATGVMTILVDVHNGESPAHVIAWFTNTASSSASNADYESERDEDLGAVPGRGEGTFWGLTLDNATVSQAVAGEVKFED